MRSMRSQTRQRDAIARAIREAAGPLSPGEIRAAALGRAPGLGIATVYRTVKLLLQQGVVRSVEVGANDVRYEPSDRAHHHHFLCRGCGEAIDIAGCPGHLSKLVPQGFILEAHEILLHGLCAKCSTRDEPQPRGLPPAATKKP
jgi:Fur family ferric uptake transcriptional regulator